VGLSRGADNTNTLAAVRALGAEVLADGDAWTVKGVGLDGMRAPHSVIDCGNAGTAMRLLAGVLAGQPFESSLVGDESLSARPMRRVTAPLSLMGAVFSGREADGNVYPPLRIVGRRPLKPLQYESPMASAQVKSAILLAGLYADGETRVVEPGPSRDHTERMLKFLGAPVKTPEQGVVCIDPTGWDRQLAGAEFVVPADPSSAAFVVAAALVVNVDRVAAQEVCVNPSRTGFLDALALMGARVEREAMRNEAGEPTATLVVSRGAAQSLAATRVSGDLTVRAIDELPILAVVAAFADGVTEFCDAAELRVKESDRIATTVAMLREFGVEVSERPDGFSVVGSQGRTLRAARVDSAGDHRIAMAFSIAGLRATAPIIIHDCANVNTSFPEFRDLATQLGLNLT
jgi:3-phosphoshikimate 1-carboxyvinyltransferase